MILDLRSERMNLALRKTSTFPFLPLPPKQQRETLTANVTLKNRAQTPASIIVKLEVITFYI